MANLVTYGLDKVHIAFSGVAQAEQIIVTAPCTTDGEITVTVTATTIIGAGSPVSVIVPLSAETHTTTAKVASAIGNALTNNATVSGKLSVYVAGSTITLTAKTVAANDATLAIAATVGSTGVTVGASTEVAAGTDGWGVPQAVPGAQKWTPKPEGKEVKRYADNRLYYFATQNDGYTGDLELALMPDEILAEMLGWLFDANGMLVEIADGIQKEFAILFEVSGDKRKRRNIYYSCKAARPAREESTTEESADPKSDKLSVTVAPIEINGRKIVRSVAERGVVPDAVFDAWFDAVTVPTF